MKLKNLVINIGLLVIIFSLSGCIKTAVEVTPESMKGKGLLVGHVSASGNGGSSFFSGGDVYIGEEQHKGAYKDGFIAAPLAPGKYSMNKLFWSFGRGGYKSLPIKAEFSIKAGEVTNLGEIFLLFPKKDSRYNMLFLNNNDDMHAFLRSKHATVYNSLKKKINKANVKYIGKKYIDNVRRVAIGQVWKSEFNKYLAIGPLGSIGIYKKDKKGKIKSIKWVKTDTYMKPESCLVAKKKAVCIVPHMTKGDRLFFANGGRYKFHKKPKGMKKGKFKLLKDNSMIWINNDFSYYRSRDNGKSWKVEEKHKALVEGSVFDAYRHSKTPQVFETKKGFYIFSKLDGSPLIFNKYKSNKGTALAKPQGDDGIGSVVETSAGIYATEDSYTLFSASNVYFQAKGKNEWKKRVVDKALCSKIKVINYKKDIVSWDCSSNGNYVSTDSGATWQHKPKKE